MLKSSTFQILLCALLLHGCYCISGYDKEYFENTKGLIANQTVVFENQDTGEKLTFSTTSVDCTNAVKDYNDDDCTCKVFQKCAQRFRINDADGHELDFSIARSSAPYSDPFQVYFQHQYFLDEYSSQPDETLTITIQTQPYTCRETSLIKDLGGTAMAPQRVYVCEELGVVRIITKNNAVWTRID